MSSFDVSVAETQDTTHGYAGRYTDGLPTWMEGVSIKFEEVDFLSPTRVSQVSAEFRRSLCNDLQRPLVTSSENQRQQVRHLIHNDEESTQVLDELQTLLSRQHQSSSTDRPPRDLYEQRQRYLVRGGHTLVRLCSKFFIYIRNYWRRLYAQQTLYFTRLLKTYSLVQQDLRQHVRRLLHTFESASQQIQRATEHKSKTLQQRVISTQQAFYNELTPLLRFHQQLSELLAYSEGLTAETSSDMQPAQTLLSSSLSSSSASSSSPHNAFVLEYQREMSRLGQVHAWLKQEITAGPSDFSLLSEEDHTGQYATPDGGDGGVFETVEGTTISNTATRTDEADTNTFDSSLGARQRQRRHRAMLPVVLQHIEQLSAWTESNRRTIEQCVETAVMRRAEHAAMLEQLVDQAKVVRGEANTLRQQEAEVLYKMEQHDVWDNVENPWLQKLTDIRTQGQINVKQLQELSALIQVQQQRMMQMRFLNNRLWHVYAINFKPWSPTDQHEANQQADVYASVVENSVFPLLSNMTQPQPQPHQAASQSETSTLLPWTVLQQLRRLGQDEFVLLSRLDSLDEQEQIDMALLETKINNQLQVLLQSNLQRYEELSQPIVQSLAEWRQVAEEEVVQARQLFEKQLHKVTQQIQLYADSAEMWSEQQNTIHMLASQIQHLGQDFIIDLQQKEQCLQDDHRLKHSRLAASLFEQQFGQTPE